MWGYLRLVPPQGIAPGAPASSAYADRALRDVRYLDYSRPGLAVVYLEEAAGDPVAARVSLRTSGAADRVRVEPSHAVASSGGAIVIQNESDVPLTVSDPAAQLLRRLDPGDRYEIREPTMGLHTLSVLDAPDLQARIFVAPGAATLVSESGRFELRDLPPGAKHLHVWHRVLPPMRRGVYVAADEVLRLDLEVGVGVSKPGSR